jgi:O-antigen/teichoic acid export membrane protein
MFPVGDFAIAALVQVVPGIVTTWAAVSYHAAIQTPESEVDALSLVLLSILLTAIVVFVVALGIYGAGPLVVRALRNPGLSAWLWAIPILILGNSVRLVIDQWMMRRGMLGELGIAMVVTTVATASFTATGLLAAAPTNFVIVGLVGGTVFGAVWRVGRSRLGHALREHRPSLASVQIVAKRFINFPRDVVPGSLLTNIGLQLPQIFLSRYFGAEITGQYSRASVLVGVPASVLGQPVAAMLAGEAGAAYRSSGDCRAEVVSALQRLAWTLIPAYFVLGVAAPVLLPAFLGPAWVPAGLLAQPMIASMLGVSIGGPLGIVLLIANRTGTNLLWQAGWLLVSVCALGAGVRLGGATTALWIFAIGNLLAYAVYALLAYRFARAAPSRATSH